MKRLTTVFSLALLCINGPIASGESLVRIHSSNFSSNNERTVPPQTCKGCETDCEFPETKITVDIQASPGATLTTVERSYGDGGVYVPIDIPPKKNAVSLELVIVREGDPVGCPASRAGPTNAEETLTVRATDSKKVKSTKKFTAKQKCHRCKENKSHASASGVLTVPESEGDQTTTGQFTVFNPGSTELEVELEWTSIFDWEFQSELPEFIVLEAGETFEIFLPIVVPGDLPVGTFNDITLTAITGGDPETASDATTRVIVAPDNHYDVFQLPDPGQGWEAAKDAAERQLHDGVGGHLAVPTSPGENDFIRAIIEAYFSELEEPPLSVWLGGFQSEDAQEPAGDWSWVTGEDWNFTNWSEHGPNEFLGIEEDRLEMMVAPGLAGVWNDASEYSDFTRGWYVVEWESPQEVPVRFIRGDARPDGRVDIGDAVTILRHIFRGEAIPCPDAADIEDSGSVDIGDAVSILRCVFRGYACPAQPYPACGIDPTPDDGVPCAANNGCPGDP